MTKIIQRHDTAANWTAANPVLAVGEMGVETDTNKFKFGDGSTVWSDLSYAAGEGGSVDAYTKAETDDLLNNKQDKLTAVTPLAIETRTTELIAGYTIGETTLVPQNNFSIHTTNKACTVTTASSLTYIDIPININKKQVCTVPFGGLADETSNLLFGYHNAEGRFVPVFSFGGVVNSYIQYLALNKTPLTPNMSAISLFASRMTEYSSSGTPASNFDKMYFQLYLEDTSLTGFISHRSGSWIYPAVKTFTPTNIDDITKITHVRYCHNNNSGPFNKADFGVYTTGELVTTATMTSPIDLSGFKNEFDLNADLSYKALIASPATTSSLGVVQPDGTSITVSDTGVISGQDVKTFSGYSDTGTLVLKSINGVLQWVAEG